MIKIFTRYNDHLATSFLLTVNLFTSPFAQINSWYDYTIVNSPKNKCKRFFKYSEAGFIATFILSTCQCIFRDITCLTTRKYTSHSEKRFPKYISINKEANLRFFASTFTLILISFYWFPEKTLINLLLTAVFEIRVEYEMIKILIRLD